MTLSEATKQIEKIILHSYEGGFYSDEKAELDQCLARIGVALHHSGQAAVLLAEIRDHIKSVSSAQGMRKHGGQYETVKRHLLIALDTLRSLAPTEQ